MEGIQTKLNSFHNYYLFIILYSLLFIQKKDVSHLTSFLIILYKAFLRYDTDPFPLRYSIHTS